MARALKIFMRGKRITMLQELLCRMGYVIQDQPGLFGTDTRDAVKAFQKQQGVKPSGIVDDALLERMQQGAPQAAAAEPDTPDPVSISRTDPRVDALIRLLVRKNLISEAELMAELQLPQPESLSDGPLKGPQ